jgi:translation initiation factor 1
MGKKKRRNPSSPVAPVEQPGTGFGGLAAALAAKGLAGAAPGAASEPTTAVGAAEVATPTGASGLSGKAVVRQERKGRGGKTVTVVDGAAITGVDDLAALAKRARKALGTGARVEGGKLVLQGDQRTSAAAWLEKQGAKVVIGN